MASTSQAFLVTSAPYDLRNRGIASILSQHGTGSFQSPHGRSDSSSRVYSGRSPLPGNESDGILGKVGKAAKSILPKKWFGSDEEKAKIQRRQETKNGIDAMLKDAPLGVRMLGKMVTPLVSSLAETMADQQRAVGSIIEEAQGYIVGDPAVTGLLGVPISLGAPFSQSSSSSSINGQVQSRVELAMPVSGPNGSGTVRLLASQDQIVQLQLDALGRTVNVSLTNSRQSFKGTSSGMGGRSSPKSDPDIIEAEIIEKKSE